MLLADWLAKIEELKQELDVLRPLPADVVNQLQAFYRIGLTYSSNCLEGNTLTEGETKLLLEAGITVGGKPLAHHLEAIGHAEALDALFNRVKTNAPPTEASLCQFHHLLMRKLLDERAGVYRTNQVLITGTDFIPPPASQVALLMQTLFETQLPAWKTAYHPVVVASFAHQQLVNIHPFVDGNGRMGRLLNNELLLQAGFPPVSIAMVLRADYLSALRACPSITIEENETALFSMFMAEVTYEGLKDYLRMVKRLLHA
ncbi:MAG: Fic family protein [Candidatus Melainabacteria bacterium]|jgi:Fic family protein|nr:Fic family protein [Candidatus Melainabacteria bacterium]